MAKEFTNLKERDLDNHEWAREVRARLADVNELLADAAGRDVIVSGAVAMAARTGIAAVDYAMTNGTIHLTLSERI